jgi:hypothetical protein
VKHPKGWAMFCMGIWLSGTVFITIVATQNFYTIDRLLAVSSNIIFRDAATALQNPTARELMRYLSSELNRLYFQYWNLLQLAVGIVALRLVSKLPQSTRAVWGIVAMLGVVLFLMLAVTPSIVSVGRSLDFVPRDPAPPGLRKFGLLHATYSAFTVVNLILGVLVTIWIQRTGE